MARSMSDQLASARARRAARPSPMRRANPARTNVGFARSRSMSNSGKACTNPTSCCSDCAKASATRASNPGGSPSRNPYALVPPRFSYWGAGWGWPYPYSYTYPRAFVAAPRIVVPRVLRPHPSRVLAASVAPYYYGYNGWGGFTSPVVF